MNQLTNSSMIKGLFETHLAVSDLQRAIDFYEKVLGLERCTYEDNRKLAFFWIGEPMQNMLGLWETPAEDIRSQHFAFRCDEDFIVNESVSYLKQRGLSPYNFLKNGTEDPMVFAWMPAISIYFKDPDGHVLEFIAELKGQPNPAWGVITYLEWKKRIGL